VVGNRVQVPKVGRVRLRLSQPIVGITKSATFKQDASGHWHVILVSDVDIPAVTLPLPEVEQTLGVDLGLTDIVVYSDGHREPPPRFYRLGERKLRRAQRVVSRRKKGSRNRARARVYQHVANQRRNFLHKLTTTMVKKHAAICTEDLSVKGLARTLLRLLRGHLRGVDLSRLSIRQVYLQEVEAQDARLVGAHLVQAVLAEAFNYSVCVALNADGAYLAAGTSNGEVRLWRVVDRAPLLAMQGHTGGVHGVALSADWRLVASGSFDGTVRLWETASGQPLATLQGHTGLVWGVAVSADGRLVASSGYDGTVRLWEAGSERPLTTLHGHTGMVFGVALSGDGQLVVSGGHDGTVRLWEATRGSPLASLHGHAGGVLDAALSGMANTAPAKARARVPPNVCWGRLPRRAAAPVSFGRRRLAEQPCRMVAPAHRTGRAAGCANRGRTVRVEGAGSRGGRDRLHTYRSADGHRPRGRCRGVSCFPRERGTACCRA
jgi:Probable transposase/WD domain, G-beta repeat